MYDHMIGPALLARTAKLLDDWSRCPTVTSLPVPPQRSAISTPTLQTLCGDHAVQTGFQCARMLMRMVQPWRPRLQLWRVAAPNPIRHFRPRQERLPASYIHRVQIVAQNPCGSTQRETLHSQTSASCRLEPAFEALGSGHSRASLQQAHAQTHRR
ncbi:hypothetical protein BAUCODRAFT_501330 [Baudoinia panamericana UAMH 10762]|uniref:Uncharacterized protein n=1 Tax=Baudoinia panamericana (strain UAMH 10762) TaxID=717646 RepID=M2NA42_BAUPA|nr:uncharacterized protein BAUCODRAFT_501330 [Baudoinia panamericana UAMH 10762]EMC95730.1 hypothetical protein BAUCODRAFT_501330 [Baudoinia panamericana UAMH 10762]